MNLSRILVTLAIILFISGCASRGGVESEPVPVEDRQSTESVDPGETYREDAQAAGATAGEGFSSEELNDPDSLLSQRVIYFDFDSNEITPQFAEVLAAHADYLATHPEIRMIVEGHTDERGSQEYNLALGERRAEAVKRILVLNGADAAQIQSISFGEEKPAQEGSNEDAWAQNRRAELLYQR